MNSMSYLSMGVIEYFCAIFAIVFWFIRWFLLYIIMLFGTAMLLR